MSKNRYSSDEQRTPDCQDWTTVTMSKSKKQDTVYKATTNTQNSYSAVNSASAVVAATSATATASASGDDDTAKKTKYIAKVTSDAVRQARCNNKLTQKELAQKCNMDVSIIAEIERGGNCVYNPTHVNKIQSVLGVKIPR
jgi:ribosome-binding protein aMBF1 (putative translation factor)